MLLKSLIIMTLILIGAVLLSGCTNIEIRKMGAAPNNNGAMLCYEELLSPKVSCHGMWYSPNLGWPADTN